MTGLQKIFFGIGVLAIIGLGVLVYKQSVTPTATAPTTTMMQQGGRSDVAQKVTSPAAMQEVPATPDAVVDDIIKEIDVDNSTLSEEEFGETLDIESEGDIVSDFGTIYDENE